MARKVEEADQLRHQFVERFPLAAWPELPVEHYALGERFEGGGVCRWLEFITKPVASMSGGSSHKHLIFRSNTDRAWRFPKGFSSIEEAWGAVRAGFVEIFDLAARGDIDEADDVVVLTGAAALRTKALFMYFPQQLVPVCSNRHVKHFLEALGVAQVSMSPIRANRELLKALREVPELADLSTQELGFFLYHWADPRSTVRVVKIAPGELARYWDDCLANSYICLGWDRVGDLSQFDSKESFREVFRTHYPYNGSAQQVSRKANEVWTLMELEPGDRIIANRGTTEVLAMGTVNDVGYRWREDRDEFRNTVGVDWDVSFARKIDPVKAWATTTVRPVSAALLRAITGAAVPAQPVDIDPVYGDIEGALARRGQVVLYGPPGTGKTYHGRRAAVWLLEGGSHSSSAAELLGDSARFAQRERSLDTARPNADPDARAPAPRLTRVTFHPSYSYEDFVEGFRPTPSKSGGLELTVVDGVFKRVCDAASKDPGNSYVVLIDEINRGNIPKIFGELLTIIEKDKRGLAVTLPQSGTSFSVPANVLLIGTMNTADRSIHLLDSALRRRFGFVELMPDTGVLQGETVGPLQLDVFLDTLNSRLRVRFGRERQIGHAVLFDGAEVVETPEAFASIFKHELVPLLQEYLYNDYADLVALLGPVIDDTTHRLSTVVDDPDALCSLLAEHFSAEISA